jgi:hypothetical protein
MPLGFIENIFKPGHILILLLGLFVAGVVVLVKLLTQAPKRDWPSDRRASVEAENERLREEIAKLKQKHQGSD